MIHDGIEKLLNYIPENKKQLISHFMKEISVDMEEGKYDIDGDDIYARIMSYPTKLQSDCTIEAHDQYVDIQFSLIGEEGITVWSRDVLECISIEKEKDFLTFESFCFGPQIQVNNKPGWFTLLKTNEAHRPQESTDGTCAVVKKGVIKIKKELLDL